MKLVRGICILFSKELKDNFASPLVYILAALYSLIIGWLFFNYLMFSKNLTSMTLTSSVLAPTFGNMNLIFLFLAPLLTMRSLAEEKKQNTIELLFQSNLSHLQIILGKFFANVVVVIFILALTAVFPIILSLSGYNDWGIVGSSYLGVLLSVMCYLSVGMFASSLTENQMVAALISFSIIVGLMLLVLSATATNNYLIQQIFQYFSVAFHYEGLVRGVIKTSDLIYYFSFIGFFIYLTERSLDSRNW